MNEMDENALLKLELNSMQVKNILRYRKKHGGFKSLEELKDLPGIDVKKKKKIKDQVDFK